MIRKMIILLGLILAISECFAVEPYRPVFSDPVLKPWRWRVFSKIKEQGLRCMAEAKDGTIWLGLDDGVRHYDGLSWRVYSLQDGLVSVPVNVLHVAHDGTVYAGSDMGISQFQGDTWHQVFPPEGDMPWPVDEIIDD